MNRNLKSCYFRAYPTTRLVRIIFCFSIFWLAAACRKKTNSPPGVSLSIESVEYEPRDYVRNALLESNDSNSVTAVELASLFQNGTIEGVSTVDNFVVSQSEYSSISAMRASLWAGENPSGKTMRLESIKINKSLPLTTLRAAGKALGLQLSFTTQANIKIYRQFDSAGEEQKTSRLELTDLPLNLENTDKLRMGDLIVLPLDGQLMTSVDGSFLRNSYSVGRVIDSLLGSSLTGVAQTGLRANLIVRGRFEMHIFKVDTGQVRVRFFQQNEKAFNISAAASASAVAQVKVIPFSKLHQISEIKKSATVRLTQGRNLQLPSVLRRSSVSQVLKDTPQSSADSAQKFNEDVRRRPDGLVEFSVKLELPPERIQNQTTSRIEALLPQINPRLNLKVRKTADALKVYSDQEIRFDAAVSWAESRTQRQQFYADYTFDLRDTAASSAYLQAVSGAAVVLSSRADLSKFIEPNQPLHNLVVAERIAQEQSSKSKPTVVRLVSASSKAELTEGQFQIKFGRQLEFALSEAWLRENYRLSRSFSGDEVEGSLVRWSFKQSTLFGLVGEKKERMSAFMSDVNSQPGMQSIYWYAQELDARTIGLSHLEQFLIQCHNILGPVATALGLEKIYVGEAEGRFRGRLVVGFAPQLLDQLFDSAQVKEEHIWRAVAQVSENFDNTFGLPFLVLPAGMPSGVPGTVNEAACQRIATNWGSFYCHYLAQEFIPRFLQAQALRTADSKSLFFESFFAKGFGANKIGSDLLARVLLQLALQVRGALASSELVVLVDARHQASASSEFNPRVTYGNSQLIQFLNQTLPAW